MDETLAGRIAEVREAIRRAAAAAGRAPDAVTLVAVSKTHPAVAVRAAAAESLGVFGENKVQEAETKIEALGAGFAEWHLIGHLQSNKARKAVRLFDVIESVDSADLARRLERICAEEGRRELRVFVQVDLGGEATKNGAPESDLPELCGLIGDCRHLRLAGLMTIPPFFDDPELVRPYFQRLRALRDRFVPGGALSMGMSHDFEIAIAEGATHVRIGTAIFGEREYNR